MRRIGTAGKSRQSSIFDFRFLILNSPSPIANCRLGVFVALCSVLSICLVGCGSKFFDPTQVGRFRPTPAVNLILDSLCVAEETPSAWEGAEEPRPVDLRVLETDYVFSPGDIVGVSIFELLQEGVPFAGQYVVTESGKLSIPEVGVIPAAGLTELQLEEEIRDILEPTILKEPSVTAMLLRSERHMVSILGNGVSVPGRYSIPRYGLRLADAIAMAGGISEYNVTNIYVSRFVTGEEVIAAPPIESVVEPERAAPEKPEWELTVPQQDEEELVIPEQEMLEIITPEAGRQWPENKLVIASAEMITDKELAEAALPEGFEQAPIAKNSLWQGSDFATYSNDSGREKTHLRTSNIWPERELITGAESRRDKTVDIPDSSGGLSGGERMGGATNEDKADRIEWIFQDGRWVPVQVGRPRPTVRKDSIGEPTIKVEPGKVTEPLEEKVPADFEWDEIGTGGVQARVIKVPVDRFQAGDPRYNIAIRSGDTVYVPVDILGEFYIMGNVNRQGAISLVGRPMTLKMAIAAAGGLGPLAWPKRCEVIRRLGTNKEEIVMVDLDKIARGEQPDFFIKVNDLINVGTHPTARWRAVLRNAFRSTYGFGFVYDRNFADRDYGTRRPVPDWF